MKGLESHSPEYRSLVGALSGGSGGNGGSGPEDIESILGEEQRPRRKGSPA